MTPTSHTTEQSALSLEPDDLDGHTIDEIEDYLDRGRTPSDPTIEASPGCRLALDALVRLRTAGADLLASDTAAEPEADDDWVQSILTGIRLDVNAGRRIPVASPDANADLGVTEGAVRALIRAAESVVPGALIGRCRLEGDVTVSQAPVRIRIDLSVPYGEPVLPLATRLRAEIAERLERHTDLNVVEINIDVHDVRPRATETEPEEQP
ncbi:Asp23/Gls24 family envelope stress response protein [Gulosibacter faecalis]|jgi:hypothetical protein|uniref:Asp23/Gls24 family envelope stress response protein n=1 Tax=Gulosibacter faecalis TaxID=272240 RepID=A0ABW5UZD1_9MICO|nr:Asp23/Gls24 family envelope stress response protein [Gulosibacter faecalis]